MKRIYVTAVILWIGMYCIGFEAEKNPPQLQPPLNLTPPPVASVPVKDSIQSVALDADPALVGWWKFDEVSGSATADSSSKNHSGILEGGLSFNTQSVPGRIGNDVKLEGKDGFIRIPDYKGITGTGPRTIAVWIKTTRPDGQIVSWGYDDFGRMWIMEFIRGRIGVTPNGGYYYMKAPTDDDAWHHVAVVIQPASQPNLHDHAKLFKDGELAEVDVVCFPFTTMSKAAPTDSVFDSLKKCDVGAFGIKPFAAGTLFTGKQEEDYKRARLALRYILNSNTVIPIPGLMSVAEVDNAALAVKERRQLDVREKAQIQGMSEAMWAQLPNHYG